MGISERQFERFRLSGSPRALGAVFDQLAPELLDVARRLVGDPVLAEDLVQLTFVTAIERVSSFEQGAPLTPWLVGILARHAKAELRRGARRPDPLRLHFSGESDPLDSAAQEELFQQVDRALGQLPEGQRSVLILRLRHGLTAPEIAEALARPAGTVRSQLARGIESLRKSLPVGLVSGGALAFLFPRGIEAMRAALVDHAASLAPPLLVAAKGSLLWSLLPVAEVLVMKKLVVAAVVALVAYFGLQALWDSTPSPEGTLAQEQPQSGSAVLPQVTLSESDSAPTVRVAAEPPGRSPASTPETNAPLTDPIPMRGTLEVQVSGAFGGAAPEEVCLVSRVGTMSRYDEAWNAQTDQRGRVVFAAIPAGTFDVRLLRGAASTVLVRGGETTRVNLALAEGFDLRGRVVDGLGEPVPGAEIWLSERWHARSGFVVTRADPRGRFKLRAVHRDNFVAALAPGFGISYVQAANSVLANGEELRIILDALGSRVEVEVVDSKGVPIEGAQVLVGDEQSSRFRAFADGASAPPPPPRHGRTDEQGHCQLSSIPIGKNPVQVRARGYGVAIVSCNVASDQVTRVRVGLAVGAKLSGIVVDENNQPVKGTAVWIGQRRSFTSSEAITDLTGHFVLAGIAAENLEVRAVRRGVGEAIALVDLQAGEEKVLNLSLIPKPSIHGTLFNSEGEPAQGFTLVARNQENRASSGTDISRPTGAFELTVDAEAEYTVFVRRPGDWRSFPLLVKPNLKASESGIELRLPGGDSETASLHFLAVAPDGNPAVGARLELWHQELKVWRSFESSPEQARFDLVGLLPGTVELTLRHEDYPMLRLPDQVLEAGDRLDLGLLAFPESGTLKGELVGLNDLALLESLEILISRVGGEYGVIQHQTSHFESSALAPGNYLLSIQGDFVVPVFRSVKIEAGVTNEIEVRLDRGGLCRVSLSPQDDADPPLWVGAQAWDDGGRVVWSGAAKNLGDGRFEARVSGPLGSLRFNATDNAGRTANCQLDLVSTGEEAPSQSLVLVKE